MTTMTHAAVTWQGTAQQAEAAAQQAALAREAALKAAQDQAELVKNTFAQLAQQDAKLSSSSPSAAYEAARAARRELESQLDNLKSERFSIANRLRDTGPGAPTGADLKGLETRLSTLDARIAAMDKQIELADAAVAKAAAIPGAVVQQPPPIQRGPPEEAFVLGFLFLFVVALPLTLAFARRIWRRSAAQLVIKPQELYERFTRLEQSLDSIAIEVERVGENQRFLTRMQSQVQDRALVAPAEREREAIGRKQ